MSENGTPKDDRGNVPGEPEAGADTPAIDASNDSSGEQNAEETSFPEEKPGIWHSAKDMAEDADRWFVSLAQTFGRGEGWARREAEVVSDSAKAAAATTRAFTHRVVSKLRSGSEPAQAPKAPPDMQRVLQPLGELVSKHGPDRYSELENDKRFWQLVAVLVRLRQAKVRAAKRSAKVALVKTSQPPADAVIDDVTAVQKPAPIAIAEPTATTESKANEKSDLKGNGKTKSEAAEPAAEPAPEPAPEAVTAGSFPRLVVPNVKPEEGGEA
jgi:hypothetical protein